MRDRLYLILSLLLLVLQGLVSGCTARQSSIKMQDAPTLHYVDISCKNPAAICPVCARRIGHEFLIVPCYGAAQRKRTYCGRSCRRADRRYLRRRWGR